MPEKPDDFAKRRHPYVWGLLSGFIAALSLFLLIVHLTGGTQDLMERFASRTDENSGTKAGENPDPTATSKPREKQVVHLAVVLNGEADYAYEILSSFVYHLDRILQDTQYLPRYKIRIGDPSLTGDDVNRRVFKELFRQFEDEIPDYLVTIGSRVSEYAHRHHADQLPIVFLGVTDPIGSGLVPSFDSGTREEEIAGVSYGVTPEDRLEFFARVFPGKTLGFLYSPEFKVDLLMRDKLLAAASTARPPVPVIPIAVTTPELNDEDKGKADIFAGWYFLHNELGNFLRLNSDVPFLAGGLRDVRHGGLAGIVTETGHLGRLGAEGIVGRHLLDGVALRDINVLFPHSSLEVFNRSAFRKHGISMPPDDVIKNAMVIN